MEKLKAKAVGQALEYCSYRKMQDMKPEEFMSLVKAIYEFYQTEIKTNE